MARQRYHAAFITGAVIGGLAGAAVTLWRAPLSGQETRSQLGGQIVAHAGPLAEPLAATAVRMNMAGAKMVAAMHAASRRVLPPTDEREVIVSPDGASTWLAPGTGALARIGVTTPLGAKAEEPVVSSEPVTLTDEQRTALDLDPVIEPEDVPERGQAELPSAAAVAASLTNSGANGTSRTSGDRSAMTTNPTTAAR